jgi:hypothetical integral membrane protein (TIGR02206 family)
VLLITAAGVVGVVWWGRSHRGTSRELAVRRGYAAVGLMVILGMQVYWLTPDVRDVRSSWPLQLSDVADYTAVYALWTLGRRASAFTYYIGLTLTLMAVLTPALTHPFPEPQWFGFWIRHIFVVWTAVYLVWGLDIRPTWRLYRTTVVAALAWAVVAYTFDVVTGANYGYLVRKPSAASALDLLGPWPWYVLAALAILLAVWAIVMTLPWEVARARALTRSRADPSGPDLSVGRRPGGGPGSATSPDRPSPDPRDPREDRPRRPRGRAR